MKILLLDIDHTISDAAWRDSMIGGPGGWDEYHLAGDRDEPIVETVRLVKDLHVCGWRIFGLTARPEKWRKITMDWCVRHGVYLEELMMRPDKNFMPSPECKVMQVKERFKEDYSSIAMVLDDRSDVVEAFKAIGITAFQVHAKMSHPKESDEKTARRIAEANLSEPE